MTSASLLTIVRWLLSIAIMPYKVHPDVKRLLVRLSLFHDVEQLAVQSGVASSRSIRRWAKFHRETGDVEGLPKVRRPSKLLGPSDIKVNSAFTSRCCFVLH